MEKIHIEVDTRFDGMRIYDFLKRVAGLSSTLIKKVKFGGVFINCENVHMRAIVHSGDKVEIRLPDEASENVRAINMPLEIIYEDEYFIAVNKPKDMPTHPSRGNHLPTLAEGLCAYFAPKKFVFRAINRLDRDTGGIVIVAKDPVSASRLSDIMKARNFTKKYLAVVSGIPYPACGIIDAPIARECEGNIKRVVRSDGKSALTEYRVLSVIEGKNSLCEITLHTGRTHQIRVHMAHIGHPLLGDFLYGERIEGESYKLHAYRISFTHPFTSEYIELKANPEFIKSSCLP